MTLKFKLQIKTKTKVIFKRESNMHSKLTFKKFKTKSSWFFLKKKKQTNKKVATG